MIIKQTNRDDFDLVIAMTKEEVMLFRQFLGKTPGHFNTKEGVAEGDVILNKEQFDIADYMYSYLYKNYPQP